MILLRWTLLLLLLANALLFFWYSMQQGTTRHASGQGTQLQRIRLLSELSQDELQQRQAVSELSAADGTGLCMEVNGFPSEADAMELYHLLDAEGMVALVGSYRIPLPQRYLLVLRTSESTVERLHLLDYLSRHGLPLLQADMSGLDSVLAVYRQRRDAERARDLLGLLQLVAEVRVDNPFRVAYRVQFAAPADEKLSNKINAVVVESLVELKIAKKVCAGVESLRRTE